MLLAVVVVVFALVGQCAPILPNVIMVIVHSLGKGDLFAPEARMGYSTPHLNKFVKEGCLLESYYVSPVSSATKASLLTGRFPFNLGLQHQLVAGTTAAIPLEVPTLAEMLNTGFGYESHFVGGWGLGYARLENTPTQRGYSSFFGFLGPEVDFHNKTHLNGFDFWDEVRGRTFFKSPAFHLAHNYSTTQYQSRVRNLIQQRNRNKPLFLTLSHQCADFKNSHLPFDTRCRFASVARKPYCAMILALDDAMGNLFQLLKEEKMWDNTLIVFSSDSGSEVPVDSVPGSNFPLRGSKATLFEGGVRGVGFLSGGALPQNQRGTTQSGLVHAVDLPAYVLTMLQQGPPLVLGQRLEVPIHIENQGRDFSSIRLGHFKLVVGRGYRWNQNNRDGYFAFDGMGGVLPPPAQRNRFLFNVYPFQLFNLRVDPLETRNIAFNYTRMVREGFQKILQRVRDVEGLYREPMLNTLHPLSLPRFHNHVWAPFLSDHSSMRDEVVAAVVVS